METNPSQATAMVTVVLMGVSGSGKSTVAAELVQLTGWRFAEGDDFHSAANVAKMRAGDPLTEADRLPWLDALAAWIGERENAGQEAIVTCSALRRSYRDRLRTGHPSVYFVGLAVSAEELAARLDRRVGHYMPRSLLASQLALYEPLDADEPGITLDATAPPAETAAAVLRAVNAHLR
jgi:gluconokinase